MEIIVSGTIGGYKKLYSEPVASYDSNRAVFGISDPRPASNNVHAIGSYAYSLKLLNGDIMMSKYIIARDTVGGSRTGNIVFSVIITSVELMSGRNAKFLLDDLHNEFCRLGYLDEDNNLYEGNINWSFIDRVKNNYNTEKRICKETLSSNGKGEAFAYYRNDDELCRFFDWPYQKTYEQFKQVYLVSEGYRNNEKNPLGALRHSDKDDLTYLRDSLERYELSFSNRTGNINIEIYVNGERCGSGTKVNKNDSIKIKYSKNNYNTECVEGSIASLASKGYVRIENDTVTVLYSTINLQPEEKRITFKVVDEDGNKKTANIHINDDNIGSNPEWVFKGDEIDKTFEVWAEDADNNLKSEKKQFNPIDTYEQKITLKEHKRIKIQLVDKSTNEIIENFSIEEIYIDGSKKIDKSRISNDTVEFIGKDEIEKTWWLKIKGYNGVRFTPHSYSDNKATIEVEKESSESVNKIGQNLYGNQNQNNNNHKRNSDDRIPWKQVIIVFGTLFVVVSILVYFLINSKSVDKDFAKIDSESITLSEIEEIFKKHECDSTNTESFKFPAQKKATENYQYYKGNLDFLRILDSGDIKVMKDCDYIPTNQKLVNIKRTIVDLNGKHDKVVDILSKYLGKENISKIAVINLEKSINSLIEIAKIDVNQPNDTTEIVNKRLEFNEYTIDNQLGEFNEYRKSVLGRLFHKGDSIKKAIKEQKMIEEQQRLNEDQAKKKQDDAQKNKVNEMLAYIKGDELKKDKLEKYKKDFPGYAKSINLCIEFWNIIKAKEFDKLRGLKNDVGKDSYLNNDSKLMIFLNNFKNNQDKVTSKLNSLKPKDWDTVSTLKQLNDKIK